MHRIIISYRSLPSVKLNGLKNESLSFIASTVLYQISRLVVSLVVARWVGPANYGIWNSLNLFLIYGIAASIGIPNGMNRLVPLYNGKGDPQKATNLLKSAFVSSLLTNFLCGVIIFGIGTQGVLPVDDKGGLVSLSFLFFIWEMYLFFQIVLKSQIQFSIMVRQQVLYSLLLPVIALPMSFLWQINGFMIGQSIVACIIIVFIVRNLSFDFEFRFTYSDIGLLIKNGLPVMSAGILYSLLTTADRWMILAYLDSTALGHYTLSILCVGLLSLTPAVIAQQLYPRMAYLFGESDDINSLLPLVFHQTVLSGGGAWVLIFSAYLLMPIVVKNMLPNYVEGIVAAKITLLGLLPLSLVGGMGNFLITIGKQGYYLAIQVVTLIVGIVIMNFLVTRNNQITSIATGMAITYCIYLLAMLFAMIVVLRGSRSHANNVSL